MLLRRLIGVVALLCGLSPALALAADAAAAKEDPAPFNHLSTGFALRGAHEHLECEACHIHGIFKGTPIRCSSCHGRITEMEASKKPASHIPTTQECDLCHDAFLPNVSWQLAQMDHLGIATGCITCHNGRLAMGKDAGHLPTNQSCEYCHTSTDTFSDNPKPDHSGFVNNCQQCHNNSRALGKPSNHLNTLALRPATADCVPCHNTVTFVGGRFDHAAWGADVGGSVSCYTCHNGNVAGAEGPAAGQSIHRNLANFPAHATDCAFCHKSTVNW